MKRHKIFNKGDRIHCLLSSQSHPDVLIPVKGFIIDTKWDRVNPKYKIRIDKFFDTIKFLKKYYFSMYFSYDFDTRSTLIPLKPNAFKRVVDLETRIKGNDEARFYVIVDSIMCTRTRTEMSDLFGRIQFYNISKKYREIREASARPFAKSALSVDSLNEWDARFKTAWGDKLSDAGIDPDQYIVSLK
jgi:hypothetical protein